MEVASVLRWIDSFRRLYRAIHVMTKLALREFWVLPKMNRAAACIRLAFAYASCYEIRAFPEPTFTLDSNGPGSRLTWDFGPAG